MKILMTGASGFIGSHLINRLQKEGHEVVSINRVFRLDSDAIHFWTEKEKPDYIFDLAAYGNHYFQTDHHETSTANIQGVYNMLNATNSYPYKGYFNFSTTFHNLEASTFYGATKSCGEYMVRAFVRRFDKPIINIRPYSVFGENEWDFRFIPTISSNIRNDKPIQVSDVSHDWVYVEDFIDGLLLIMDEGYMYKHRGQSFGLGCGQRYHNKEIAEILMKIAGKSLPIEPYGKREYEIPFHEAMLPSQKVNDEIFIKCDNTPIDQALYYVYSSPNFLRRS